MKNLKIYYATIISVLILEGLVDFLFNFPIEFHLAFLIPFIFSIYLIHPDIEAYKAKPRNGFSFSRLLFTFENYLIEKIPESNFKKYLVMYIPSFIFFLIFCLMQLNFVIVPVYLIGVVIVELIRKLFCVLDK